MRPLLSFVAIVKNEAANIAKTLASVKPWVDRWTVLDTGSTDGTQDIVRSAMAGVPGLLFQEAFDDFSATRNRALRFDAERSPLETSEFTLMLSGDETLVGGEELRAYLEKQRLATTGAYCVQMESGTRQWPYPRVLRTSGGWRYVGVRHERPVGPRGEVRGPIIPDVKIVHVESNTERKIRRIRDEDLPLFTKQVEDESIPLDERAHAIFFLAETHTLLSSECGDEPGGPKLSHQLAAMALYLRYAHIADDPKRPAYDPGKVAYAWFLYYHVADKAGFFTSEEMVSRLRPLASLAPDSPGVHYLFALHSAFLDVRQGLFVAEKAAGIAKRAKENPSYDATDVRFEWLCLRIAAACAKELNYESLMHDFAAAGIAAGGPEEVFKEYLP